VAQPSWDLVERPSGGTRTDTAALRRVLAACRWRWRWLRWLPDADEVLLARLVLVERLRAPGGAADVRRWSSAAESGDAQGPLTGALARGLADGSLARQEVHVACEAAERLKSLAPVTHSEVELDLERRALGWPEACLAAGGERARANLERARPLLRAALLAEEWVAHLEHPRAQRIPWIPAELQVEVRLSAADWDAAEPTPALSQALAQLHGRAERHWQKARALPGTLDHWRALLARLWLGILGQRLEVLDQRGARVWKRPIRHRSAAHLVALLARPQRWI
jgi:hypothetical protein